MEQMDNMREGKGKIISGLIQNFPRQRATFRNCRTEGPGFRLIRAIYHGGEKTGGFRRRCFPDFFVYRPTGASFFHSRPLFVEA